MNIKSLTMALRNKAIELSNVAAELSEVDATTPQQDQTLRDAAELIRVLARHQVEGKSIAKAFGAPGDWGYETPVGSCTARTGRHPRTRRPRRPDHIDQAVPHHVRGAAADHLAAAWDCSTCGRRK